MSIPISNFMHLYVFLASCISIAIFDALKNRSISRPCGIFLPAYALLTAGPIIFSLVSGSDIHRGIKVHNLGASFSACTVAAFSFWAGTLLVGQTRQQKGNNLQSPAFDPSEQQILFVRNAAIAVGLLIIIPLCYTGGVILASQPPSGVPKSHVLASLDPSLVAVYQRLSNLLFLCSMVHVIADAQIRRRYVAASTVCFLFAGLLIGAAMGEREALISFVVWILLNRSRMPMFVSMSGLASSLTWLMVSPNLRRFGLGFHNQLEGLAHVDFFDSLYNFLCPSCNLLVLTNVMDLASDTDQKWWGSSYLGSLLSFVPGAPEWTELTPMRWFATVYDRQGVAGVAFGPESEAFLNFGWIGIPIVFVVWGLGIAWIHNRCQTSTAGFSEAVLWYHSIAVSIFAIRCDSRPVFKLLAVGIVISVVTKMLFSKKTSNEYKRMRLGRRNTVSVGTGKATQHRLLSPRSFGTPFPPAESRLGSTTGSRVP